MTRKTLVSAVCLALALAGAMLCCDGCKDNAQPSAPGTDKSGGSAGSQGSSSVPASTSAFVDEPPAPPPPAKPDIALLVNSSHELTVVQGTPLIVTVRLANGRAANALAANAATKEEAQAQAELAAAMAAAQTKPAAGSKPSASAPSASAPAAPPVALQPVPMLRLPANWPAAIRFELVAESGPAQPLKWPLAMATSQPAALAELDGRTNPDARWGLAPQVAADIAPGVYRLAATMDAPEGKDAGWSGQVRSEPVVLTVKARPADLAGADAAEANIADARYWAAVGDWDKSLASARLAGKADAKSIAAFSLEGDALAAKGDATAAIAAYSTAIKLYDDLHKADGDNHQPPDRLLDRVRALMLANPPKNIAAPGTKAPPPPPLPKKPETTTHP